MFVFGGQGVGPAPYGIDDGHREGCIRGTLTLMTPRPEWTFILPNSAEKICRQYEAKIRRLKLCCAKNYGIEVSDTEKL